MKNLVKKIAILAASTIIVFGCEDYQARQQIKALKSEVESLKQEQKSTVHSDFNNDNVIDLGFVTYNQENGLEIGFTITNKYPFRNVDITYKAKNYFKNPEIEAIDVNDDGRKDLILKSLDNLGRNQTHYLINNKDYNLNFFKVN